MNMSVYLQDNPFTAGIASLNYAFTVSQMKLDRISFIFTPLKHFLFGETLSIIALRLLCSSTRTCNSDHYWISQGETAREWPRQRKNERDTPSSLRLQDRADSVRVIVQ